MNKKYMQCSSYCMGEAYSLLEISQYYTTINWNHKIYERNVLHVKFNLGDIFIYDFGCIVFWGLNATQEEKIILQLKKFLINSLNVPILDHCNYIILHEETHIDSESDVIVLEGDDPYIKLSFSYGLSQSVKITVFEESIKKTIEENRQIPYKLIETGRISLSRKELAKKIGLLFIEKTFINLNNHILDTPDFFWEGGKYEPFYIMSVKYLDIQKRMKILNLRLNIIHDLYEMMSAEVQHMHSSRLELIVIYLILIEVVLVVVKDFLKLL